MNPNQWFRNVELMAAADIGQETVQYVGNVYKYYVTYKLAMERRTSLEAVVAKETKRK